MLLLPFIEQVHVRISGYGPVRGLLMPGDGSVRPVGIVDGTSNTIVFGETASNPQDGTSNTIGFGETAAGDGSVRSVSNPQDGTSNTIVFGETTGGDGSVRPVRQVGGTCSGRGRSGSGNSIQDGTSNTITFGEVSSGDGSVRTGTGVTDGTSNTIVFGETQAFGDGSVRSVTDGTSNTILIGERQVSPLWGNPKLLRGSFGLLLPAHLTVLFRRRSLDLLIGSRNRRGLRAANAQVRAIRPVLGGRALVTMTSNNIIGILIAL